MYKIIRQRFNTGTIIIALLFIISIFNLHNTVKSKNKENKQILKGGLPKPNNMMMMLMGKMFLVSFILCLCLLTFTTVLSPLVTDFTMGVIVSLIISIIVGGLAGFGLALIPNNWGDRSIKLIINFGVSIGLLIGLIDRLLVTSYTMGCIIESSNFAASIYDQTGSNEEFKKLWHAEVKGLEEKAAFDNSAFGKVSKQSGVAAQQNGGNEEEEDFSQYTTAAAHKGSEKLNPKLAEYLFGKEGSNDGILWHKKCTPEEEAIQLSDNLDEKAYCYTSDHIEQMRRMWAGDAKAKEQAIFNTCMKMYYANHSLAGSMFTSPAFIGFRCSARYAFFINLISFSSGIILLILSDKEKGLTKLGSLVGAKNYQETFSDL